MQANRDKLQILLSDFNTAVVCLQEMQIKANNDVSIKYYSIYHRPVIENNGTFHRGAAILIKKLHCAQSYRYHHISNKSSANAE